MRVAALDAADTRFGHLLERLEAVTALGPIGQLAAPAGIRKNRDAAGEGVRMVTEVRAWRETVRAWRETARLDMRGQPGRKVGDRRVLAAWVALQLARERVPLMKSADGIFARVLDIVYESCCIKAPLDLYDDVGRAIHDTAPERHHLP